MRDSLLKRASKPALDIAAAGEAYDHEVRMLLQNRRHSRRRLVAGDQAQRTMCSRSVRSVHSGGSMLPFHSACRASRRRTVRPTTCHMTSARGKSNQISRSAHCARIADLRVLLFHHPARTPAEAVDLRFESVLGCPARAVKEHVYLNMRMSSSAATRRDGRLACAGRASHQGPPRTHRQGRHGAPSMGIIRH